MFARVAKNLSLKKCFSFFFRFFSFFIGFIGFLSFSAFKRRAETVSYSNALVSYKLALSEIEVRNSILM